MTSLSRPVGAIAALAALLSLPQSLAAQQSGEQSVRTSNGARAATQLAVEVPESVQLDDPWLYRGGDIPVDPEWIFGETGNGLRYAVRENGVPPGQVSIRVRIDAGSMFETEGEQGFAHLIEHLSFRESRYLENNQAIQTWQRLGASFGSDTNAQTSPTHTVYQLDLPNADRTKLDETFRLLSGMIQEPALSEANLAAEVPIVLAELRERAGPGMRVADESRRIIFADQLLSERSPIGTVETLRGATPQAVRGFHQRWYRPQETTIVAVGDVDPIYLAQLIERYFGEWTVAGDVTAEPDFGAPVAPPGADPANPVGELAVLVEPDLPRAITLAWLRPWEEVVDNLEYNRGLLLDSIALAIINRRLEARARGNSSILFAQVGRDDVSRSADGTFASITPLGPDWQGALADVRGVIADALAEPPTQEEIDREVAEFAVGFANRVEQSDIQAGSALADTLVNAVDIREMVASPEVANTLFTGMSDRFNPAEVYAHTQALFTADVIRAVVVTPVAGEANEDALRLALNEMAGAAEGSRLAAQTVDFADLPPIGEPGEIVSQRQIGGIGFEQITFANGVEALLWDVDNEPGRATVKVRFGAGYRAFTPDQAPYIELGSFVLPAQGLGPLGQEELDRAATGRKFGFDFSIEDGVFALSADTREADVPDQLYLFAGKLAMPRWDANPVLRARAASELGYESYGSSAIGVINRDLSWILAGEDDRYRTPDPAALEGVTADGFRAVWEPILSQGPIEVLVFGDIDREETIAALTRTFGALPPRDPIPAAVLAREVPFLSGNAEPILLTHRGEVDQAAAAVAWETGGGVTDIADSRRLEILSQLFNNRLLDALREEAGASYAPQVVNNWPLDIDSGGYMLALAQLPPEMSDEFFAAADRIARDLATEGPTEDELARVTEPLRQLLLRAQTGHGFWLLQLEGSTQQPERLRAISSLMNDYTRTTPEEMRALAERYLQPGEAVRVEVLEQGVASAR